jgi:twitching motility protein PilT
MSDSPREHTQKLVSLVEILTAAVQVQATDVHLKAGIVPVIRRHGTLRPLSTNYEPLTAADLERMAMEMMDEESLEHFKKYKEVDLSWGVKDVGRFRVNVFQQRGSIRLVMRIVPMRVPELDSLGLPPVVKDLANYERGLILVTGVTGSGKSTTLAAMVDHINRTKNRHILTIEDPIEYLIRDKKSIVSQRELGVDTTSFARALKAGLRQDPDVILIGEMRDQETIDIALEAAETGHLVLSTLHTLDAAETINRVITTYEPFKQLQIRRQLAAVLKGCISQRLAKRADKSGFIPACEILIVTNRIKELIEDPERTREIPTAIEQGRGSRMQSFDFSIMQLVKKNIIEYEEGLRLSGNPEDFALRFSGIEGGGNMWGTEGLDSDPDPQPNPVSLKDLQPVSLEIEKIGGVPYKDVGHGKKGKKIG